MKMNLPNSAKEAALDFLRHQSYIPFWDDEIVRTTDEHEVSAFLGLHEPDYTTRERAVRTLATASPVEFASFTITFRDSAKWNRPGLMIKIKDDFEWDDVIREAWQQVEKPNPHCLTDNALKLWIWIKSKRNTGKPISPASLAAQAHLRGSGCQDAIGSCLREVRRKAEASLYFEMKDGMHTIWFSDHEEETCDPENPTLNIPFKEFQFSDLERFRTWLYGKIKAMEFSEADTMFYIYKIGDRKTFKACFPKFPRESWPKYQFEGFLNALDLIDGIQIGGRFEEGEPWIIACRPEDEWTWEKIKSALRGKESEIPLEKKYDLSPDARALLKWILALKPSDFFGKLTPPIEKV